MIDDDETNVTDIDREYCDLEAQLYDVSVDWLTFEGWEPPPVDFFAAPEGVRRTVWSAMCYAIICASADSFAATASPQAQRAAITLAGLKWTADALARPGVDRSGARAVGVNFAAASMLMIGGRSRDKLNVAKGGLAAGPKHKAELTKLTWRQPLENFMRNFLAADPHRAALNGPTIWKAFNEAEPDRRAKALANKRGWPDPKHAARVVNRIRKGLVVEMARDADV